MRAFVVLLVGVLVLLWPFAIIGSLNTLFGLSIPFTFVTWVSTLVLTATFSGKSGSKK